MQWQAWPFMLCCSTQDILYRTNFCFLLCRNQASLHRLTESHENSSAVLIKPLNKTSTSCMRMIIFRLCFEQELTALSMCHMQGSKPCLLCSQDGQDASGEGVSACLTAVHSFLSSRLVHSQCFQSESGLYQGCIIHRRSSLPPSDSAQMSDVQLCLHELAVDRQNGT